MKALNVPLTDRQRHVAERAIVGTFLFVPMVGFFVALFFSLQDPQKFWETVKLLAALVAVCVLHIQFVRPYFRRFPWVASYSEIRASFAKQKGRSWRNHPKWFYALIRPRLLRSVYRWVVGLLVLAIAYGLWRLLGHHFLWWAGMYALTGLGVTAGFHRVGTHPSYKVPTWLRAILLSAGSTANQGLVGEWIRKHTKHHAWSETSLDVHSPIVLDPSLKGVWMEWVRQFFHSWCMWALNEPSLRRKKDESLEAYRARLLSMSPHPNSVQYRECDADYWEGRTADGRQVMTKEEKIARTWKGMVDRYVELESDKVVGVISHPIIYFALLAASIAVPYWLGGISFWESLSRLAFLSWATFSVNSVSHLWGERPFDTPDHSTNNAYVELVSLGEGGHANHHMRPGWAVHGIFAWQFDPTWKFILLLQKMRLAYDVHIPSRRQVVAFWRDACRRKAPGFTP